MRNRSRTGTLAVVTSIMAAGVLPPATTLAGAPTLHVDTLLGHPCVAGEKPTDGPITVKLLRADGSTRGTRAGISDDTNWFVCFFNKPPVPGNKLRMTTDDPDEPDGTVTRTVKIPDLTARANRVTNVVNGDAPAGVDLSIEYRECTPGGCEDEVETTTHANSQGRYRKDLSGSADIDGSDRLNVIYENTHGDIFFRQTLAPYMEITARNKIFIACQPKGTTTVKLRKSDGTLRASKSLTSTVDCGFENGSFKKNGDPVIINTGNRISADFASDALLKWPAMSVNVSGTTVSGRCLKNAPYMVSVVRATRSTYDGTTDVNGDFATDVGPPAFQPGDELDLSCETIRGDRVRVVRTL